MADRNREQIELNVFVFPLQWLLWVGGLIVVAGGVIALGRKPARRRETSDDVTHQEPGATHV